MRPHPLAVEILSSACTLGAPGPRTVVQPAEAADIAARWSDQLSANPGVEITTIDVSCRAWPIESLRVLEPILLQVRSTVRTLKIDDVIASLPTEQGFETLRFFSVVFHPADAPLVENVFLSFNALGSRFLDEDFEQNCRDLIDRPNLRRLDLNNTGMSIAVCQELSVLLRDVAGRLLEIRLGKNQMHPEGAAIVSRLLSRCVALEQLDYGGSRPMRDGTASFCGGLREMADAVEGGRTALTELNLRDAILGDGSGEEDAVHALCAVLRASPNVTRLNVWDGELGFNGFELVAAALVESKAKLESLDVGGLCLGDEDLGDGEGVAALAGFIREYQTETLAELNAEDNMLEDDGLATLLPVLVECKNLRVLNLSGNEWTEEGFTALAENPIPNLQKLYVKDDSVDDLDEALIERIRALYPTVFITEDDAVLEDIRNPNFAASADAVGPGPGAEAEAEVEAAKAVEEEEEEKDAEVDDLADALGAANIS